MKTMEYAETIAASDLKVGRCRKNIERIKLCEYPMSRSFLLLSSENTGSFFKKLEQGNENVFIQCTMLVT